MKKMTVLAVIPARAGSKRFPGKSKAVLGGKPLIAWTIEAAKKSGCFKKIMVSTDDKAVIKIAKRFGAEAPFLRPKRLATSTAKSVDVLLHALEYAEKNENFYPTHVMLLQPTSPLRSAKDIRAAVDLLKAKKTDSVVSVCPAVHDNAWIKNVDEKGILKSASKKSYLLNGAVYLLTRDHLVKKKSFYSKKTVAYVMPRERSVDIDWPWQLKIAESLL